MEKELFGVLKLFLLLQQARGHRAHTFKAVTAGRGGKAYLIYRFSVFAWSMSLGGTLNFFCAAISGLCHAKRNRML